MADNPASPLDVMLAAMRACLENEDMEGAVAAARQAAPYVHSRPRQAGRDPELPTMTDEELDELCATGPDGTAVEGVPEG